MSQNNQDYTHPPKQLHPLFKEALERRNVANEIASLRQEIQWLREMLIPPKSALIIGLEVERVLKEITDGYKK